MIQVLCKSSSWDMEKVEFVYKLFTRGVLISHSQLVLLVINPPILKARHYGDFFSQCRSFGLVSLMWNLNPSLLEYYFMG